MIEQGVFKSNFVGRDGFNWWIGQIAPEKAQGMQINGAGWGNRRKVRIMGYHPPSTLELKDNDLPWAQVLLPPTAGSGKGTSSRSTKLVHGGVRYLKNGEISLVIEALKERGLMLKNAPHLVRNMSFVIPTYDWWNTPFYGVGLKVYDLMAGKLGLGPSEVLSKKETIPSCCFLLEIKFKTGTNSMQ